MAPRKNDAAWWDQTWSTMAGCYLISAGCLNCFAARDAGTLQASLGVPLYRDTTEFKGARHVFNGKLTELPPGHPEWTSLLRWGGAPRPLLGAGKPSLVFVNGGCETFSPKRSRAGIARTLGIVTSSDHIGLLLTKLPEDMVSYITAQHPATQQRWRRKLWLGFSAEDQVNFDKRWPAMRTLSQQGWLTFVSVAPMIGPVVLPDDFLALVRWVIVSGEQGLDRYCRWMDADWARAVRDQCVAAGIPFFLKQMTMKLTIPPDLRIRQFPVPEA